MRGAFHFHDIIYLVNRCIILIAAAFVLLIVCVASFAYGPAKLPSSMLQQGPQDDRMNGIKTFSDDLNELRAATTTSLQAFSNLEYPFALSHRSFVAQVRLLETANTIGVRYLSTNCEDCFLPTNGSHSIFVPNFLTYGSQVIYYYYGINTDAGGRRHYVNATFPVELMDKRLPLPKLGTTTYSYVTGAAQQIYGRQTIVANAPNASFYPHLETLDTLFEALVINY